jgi:hypothetical protein
MAGPEPIPPLRVRRHGRASPRYQALLRKYLRGRLALDVGRPEDRQLVEDIIRAADGRFAYVSFLADRLELQAAPWSSGAVETKLRQDFVDFKMASS